MSLLDELAAAEKITSGQKTCSVCEFIAAQEDPDTKVLLTAGAAGSIGARRLAVILRAHGNGAGEKTVLRHRNERHEP